VVGGELGRKASEPHGGDEAEGRYYLLSGERNEESLRRLDYSLCPPEVRERFLGSH